jgi:FimV-like protein
MQQQLSGQYADLSDDAKQLHGQYVMLAQRLARIQAGTVPESSEKVASTQLGGLWAHTKAQWFTPDSLKVASMTAFLLVMLMAWILWGPRRALAYAQDDSTYAQDDSDEDDDAADLRDEYDFMGSEEGMPAKLDLARAYIDMGDNDSASDVLSEVMKKATQADHQAQAKAMLASLPDDQ